MCDSFTKDWGKTNIKREEIENKKVVELGSRDINGSLRYIVEPFRPSLYVGLDIKAGKGVDIIWPAERLLEIFKKESFDVVICTCTLEHIKDWQKVLSNMKNVLRSGGLIYLAVPHIWKKHEYPFDFWRYRREDIENIFSDCKILILDEDKKKPSNIYVKIKKIGFSEKDLRNYKLPSVEEKNYQG